MTFVLLLISASAGAGANASNLLAAVDNTDLRIQYFDLDGPERREYWADSA